MPHQLSPKRQEALDLQAKGLSVRQIAGLLNLSTQRVYRFLAEAKEEAK